MKKSFVLNAVAKAALAAVVVTALGFTACATSSKLLKSGDSYW
ncbi:hypothetical protein AGMMS49944_30710 [Spirochaetia bacterium]|nr:hypothetical protein AGMMS49944_30710 [Spirochaetia bacterium]